MNPRLTRQVGALLATAEALQAVSSVLTDTHDLIVHRQFQGELADFVRAHQVAGNLPENPLAFMVALADRVEQLLTDIETFVRVQLELGQAILTKERLTLTKAMLDEIAGKVEDALANLVAREHEFAAAFDPCDLLVGDSGLDFAPELAAVCRLKRPQARVLRSTTRNTCQFTFGQGPVHADVVLHLQSVAAAAEELLAEHARHTAVLQEARALAEAGDYVRAAKLFGELNPLFRDLPYDGVSVILDKWSGQLRGMQSRFDRVKVQVLADWRAPVGRPWQVTPREELAVAEVQEFQNSVVAFHASLDKWPASDFEKDGRQLVKKLNEAARQLLEMVAANFARARRVAQGQFVGLVLGLLVAGWFWEISWPIVAVLAVVWGLVRAARAIQVWREGKTRLEFKLEANGRIIEDPVASQICLNGEIFQSGAAIKPGVYRLTLHSKSFEPLDLAVTIATGRRNDLGVIKVRMHQQAHTNSLGLPFVPIAGTSALFCRWPTRGQDFLVFSRETNRVWPAPNFQQEATHPAVNITWHDAGDFCVWLTAKEQALRLIGPKDKYRLPTDAEWSTAVGLGVEVGATPAARDGGNEDKFPWGTQWPPPKNAGNYDPSLQIDSFSNTSPVGSFAANDQGLYDLGGNVWEWCEDRHSPKDQNRTLRGGCWCSSVRKQLLSSARIFDSPGHRIGFLGFRCVLEVHRPSPVLASIVKPPTGAITPPAAAKA